MDPGYLSEPSAVEFATEGGLTAFMNYYPPRNKVGVRYQGGTRVVPGP